MSEAPGERPSDRHDRSEGGLAWREAGEPDRPTVLFLHGLGGSRTAWDTVLEALAGDWHCVAWDLPGYGESAPIEPLTFDAIADAAAVLLDRLGVERAGVVGLSFGGQQALHFVLRHPERVDRLVLADTSAVFGADGTDVDEWKQLRLGPLDRGVTPTDMAAGVIDAITADGFAGPERDRAIAAFSRIPSAGLRAAVHCLPTHDVRDRLGDIAAPTLVIVGERDVETPPEYAAYLAEQIPNALLAVVPGVGHLTPSEAPAEFARLVRAHLARDLSGTEGTSGVPTR